MLARRQPFLAAARLCSDDFAKPALPHLGGAVAPYWSASLSSVVCVVCVVLYGAVFIGGYWITPQHTQQLERVHGTINYYLLSVSLIYVC